MLRQDVDEEDLRSEIYSLRKHITRVCSENQILKVKIRKLQDEMMKRDKHLDEFLQSKRFFGFPKNLQEKGASVLMNLKVKNERLEQSIIEKDITIKRLQNTLQTAKLYNTHSLNKKFASKGIECNLLVDNRMEYQKKGTMNTKIELHMPNFDTGDFGSFEESDGCETNSKMLKKKNLRRIESEFPLNDNFELKPASMPSYCYETRRWPSYHMEMKGSKSDGLIGELSREYISVEGLRKKKKDHTEELQDSSLKYIENDVDTNPAFQKILNTLQELMSRGTNMDLNISRTMTIDESVQFPFVESGILRIGDSTSNGLDCNRFVLSSSKWDKRNIVANKILENEEPPSILEEIQVTDQSDGEGNSVNEKIDRMEKFEVEENRKIIEEKEMPHEEIKQLHVYLLDMISQVDSLKDTISQMKADQEKTETDLKTKDESIDKLAKEIEELRELRSFPSFEISKKSSHLKANVEVAEKDNNASVEMYEIMQKTTQQNIKKIAGKIKHLRDSKSKSSISSQTDKKSSRSSSKTNKTEKKKSSDKNTKKPERKVQGIEPKKIIGHGNGDVVDVPFYRCGIVVSSPEKSTKNEFDELD